MSALAHFTIVAGRVAGSTVTSLQLQVVTSSLASSLPCGTVYGASAISTNFTSAAFHTASTAVFAVILCINACVVAVGLTFGASRLHTLSLVTIILSGTFLCFASPLKTPSLVFHANFVFSWNHVSFRRATPGVFLALVGRAIGNTLVLLTLFKVFANRPTITLAPNTTLAGLCPLHTCCFVVGR